jgi:hypothetical protein
MEPRDDGDAGGEVVVEDEEVSMLAWLKESLEDIVLV